MRRTTVVLAAVTAVALAVSFGSSVKARSVGTRESVLKAEVQRLRGTIKSLEREASENREKYAQEQAKNQVLLEELERLKTKAAESTKAQAPAAKTR